MPNEVIEMIKNIIMIRGRRALNWVVLAVLLPNIPIFLGYERLLPHFQMSPDFINSVDWALLIEYSSVALSPIFIVHFASWILFEFFWWMSLHEIANVHRRFARTLTPMRMRFSSSSLSLTVGQMVSAVLLLANLYIDICSEFASGFTVHGNPIGTFAVAIVMLGGLCAVISSVTYCFMYWKANEADAAIESILK